MHPSRHIQCDEKYQLAKHCKGPGRLSYGASLTDSYHRAAIYAARILKGEKLADLLVMLPTTKFVPVIILKTAKSLGLSITAPGVNGDACGRQK
jgi:ABC-type uncharacterized transport system substrate-binding protein